MLRLMKYAGYLLLFGICYAIFLYWVFPYDALKERVLSEVERQLGGGIIVSADSLRPYWFTGVDVEGLMVEGQGEKGLVPLVKLRKVRARAASIPLLFGRIQVSFDVEIGKGAFEGDARVSDELIALNVDLDDIDLSQLAFIKERLGVEFVSRVDGEIQLEINRQQPVRSTGTIDLSFRDLRILASQVTLGEMSLELPELQIAKGKDSRLKVELSRGAAVFESFKLAESDLLLDLTGKVFLSSKIDNYRLNLNGFFGVSPKLGEVLPFLFIVDSQKREDGNYPLSITGRLIRPSVKIGTFTLPI